MSIYTRGQATASRLLAKYGQGAVTLTRTTTTIPDASEPWNTEETTETFTLEAVVKGVSERFVDGTTILASDLEIIAAVHADVTPQAGDALSIDGTAVQVLRIMPKPAAGTPVAYVFLARR